MRDLPKADFAMKQLEELLSNQRYELERSNVVNERWILWLAIGNGVALVSVSSKLIEKATESLVALLMPSCWLFALGLIAAGATTPSTLKRHHLSRKLWRQWTISFRNGEELQPMPQNDEATEKFLYKFEITLEILAAAFFALGLLYPLATLCMRYFCTGRFFPI
ncbi:hypothetical protein [uncultured Brevundimonas sp.]|uniref:hypothetical protein n=1 Tax=uncultured Brevundimonas sp. TaxID=213418 RepID=UPI002621BE3E|nr:hypothetical protein [uncultured Brevundimonas sp.]